MTLFTIKSKRSKKKKKSNPKIKELINTAKEKQTNKKILITYKRNSIMAYFSLEIMKARKKLNNILRVAKSINKNEEICFRCKGTSSSIVKGYKKLLKANSD